jgi:hypothetical protein
LKKIQEREIRLPRRSLEIENKEEHTEHLLEFHPPENIGLLLGFCLHFILMTIQKL